MTKEDLSKVISKGNKALNKLLPPLETPDIFKKIIRGKRQKANNSRYSYPHASTRAFKKTVESNYRQSPIYSQGSGLGAINKAIGLAQGYSEAFIKVDKASKGIKTANHLLQAALYISRNGLFEVEDQYGDKLNKTEVRCLVDSWSEEMLLAAEKADKKTPAAARRFILSCPKGSNHESVVNIAREFGQEFFKQNGFDYVFVLHCKSEETPNEPDHPHVHFLIKAKNHKGQRLNLRKNDLKFMRERVAVLARPYGIELNATNRALRGVLSKAEPIELVYDRKRKGAATEQSNSQKWAISRKKQATKNSTREQMLLNAKSAIRHLKATGEVDLVNLAQDLDAHFTNLSAVNHKQLSHSDRVKSAIAAKKRAQQKEPTRSHER